MEIGHTTITKGSVEEDLLLRAFATYCAREAAYWLQEGFDIKEYGRQSQTFERVMDGLYDNFWDLKYDIKKYLYDKSPCEVKRIYEDLLLTKNVLQLYLNDRDED
jgi:hypothetical protein